MVFGLFGFGQDKPKPNAAEREVASGAGTGYGGKKGDKKRLLAGRKRAEKASTRDDKEHLCFLQEMQQQLAGDVDGEGVDAEDQKKIASLLKNIFQNQVPSEWGKRQELYAASLALTRALAADAARAPVLGDEDDPEGVLFWLLDFRAQGAQIVRHHHRRSVPRRQRSLEEPAQEDRDDVRLAADVIEAADAAVKMARRCRAPKPEAEVSVVSLRERYQAQLGPLRFDSVDALQDHFFLKKVPYASPSLKTRLIFKELAAYRTALPVEYGSSCFCRVLGSRMDLLRVLITGPDDTPYANGCFFFDMCLPTLYPRVPPWCQFLTTGGGKLRFNPNLYDCGKVCLSLLGTWAGPGWISGQSTLLQVLISIQSLILVPDPYFNEPCFERDMGTTRGKAQSRAYNQNIRKHTLSAALEAPLKSLLSGSNPYVEFEPVMIKHFLEKSLLIQQEIRSWAKDDPSLLPTCDHVCNQLTLLTVRERGSIQSTRSCRNSALAKPIVLDDPDVGQIYVPEKSNGAAKPNKTIEIDTNEGEIKEASKPPPD